MAHAQKPDFFFRRNGLVHLNRRGRQFSRLLAAEVCASAVAMLDTSCSEIVSPSLPLPCVAVCHHISPGVYLHRLVLTTFIHLTIYTVYLLQYIYIYIYIHTRIYVHWKQSEGMSVSSDISYIATVILLQYI